MDSQNDPIVKVNQLWKVFDGSKDLNVQNAEELAKEEEAGAVVAVRNVDFQVNQGEIFVIMGLSGSGKSTLIRCLLRLIEPTEGEIIVNGHEVSALPEKELTGFRREEIAMVFQHYGLLPHRTVLENVAFGLKLRGEKSQERKEKAKEVVAKVGLSGWEEHFPYQLSGGMRQRVGIARALAQDVNILLMDEPFSGLDPLIRRDMQDELIRLQAEFQKTIIFVTHDLHEALRMGDQMAIMREGQFVQVATPEEIVAQPADDYVERFVRDEREIMGQEKEAPSRERQPVSPERRVALV